MNILVENNCSDLLNMGDVAMLQVTVQRLHERVPGATIRVVTARPDLLRRYCPTAEPVSAGGRIEWLCSRGLFGRRLHELMPGRVDAVLCELTEALRCRHPRLVHKVIQLKAGVRRKRVEHIDSFMKAFYDADMLAVSGGGDINDEFANGATGLLEVCGMAIRKGIPAVMFGQGIGPIGTASLRTRAGGVLPGLRLLGTRERRLSVPLLESIGVSPRVFRVTGDDAIELAYNQRVQSSGRAIGVNLRKASYSGMDAAVASRCKGVLQRLASDYGTELSPIPISFYPDESDLVFADELVGGSRPSAAGVGDMQDPVRIIEAVGRCRIVVTGSYHAAVFALAQGIPAIGLARSQYYRSKFLGLSDMFDGHCDVLSVDDVGFAEMLRKSCENAWAKADALRPLLQSAAQRQVKAGRRMYDEACGVAEPAAAEVAGVAEEQYV
jgi:polysaccharide pyruvyl transferase WcaK-like protein